MDTTSNASAFAGTLAAQPLDQIIAEEVEAYYAGCGKGPLPPELQTAREVYDKIRKAVLIHNALAPSREDKWKVPSELPPAAVFHCARRHRRFVNILGEDGTKVLAMYVDDPASADYGTYVTNESRMRAAIRCIVPTIKRNAAKEVLAMLGDWAPVVEVEQDRDLIPVNNGIFDYRTKELMPFDPGHVFLAKLPFDMPDHPISEPVVVQPNGKPWTFTAWLAEVIDDPDTREVVWDVLGALLRPRVNWLRIVFLIGVGRNGKGTLIELMRALVGRGNCAALSLKHFGKQTDLVPLLGAMANIADENDDSFIPTSELIKGIADHNAITVRKLYNDPFTFRPHMLNVQAMNDLPVFKDKSDGMHNRILAILFAKQFLRGQNDNTAIKDDYIVRPEVVQWVAYHALVERPAYYELGHSAETDKCLATFRTETDPVRQFWQDEVMGGVAGCFLPYSFLHAWYTRWLRDVSPSSTAVSQRTLTRRIKDIAAADG